MVKRGRPLLPPDEGKRCPINMRTTRELRAKIDAGAKAGGRSMAAEIEHRLEMSYRDTEWADEIAVVVRKEVQELKALMAQRERAESYYRKVGVKGRGE